jgi:hypothetical protein
MVSRQYIYMALERLINTKISITGDADDEDTQTTTGRPWFQEDQFGSIQPKFDTFAAILTPGPRVSIVDSMGYAI